MKMIKHCLLILVCMFFFLFSCNKENEYAELLPGTWKAYDFTQNDKSVDFDLSRLTFTFSDKGTYSFVSSNLSTQEAGSYHLISNILYTTDTLAAQRLEKAVKIEKLSTDSIQFLMNDGGVKQKIFLYKSR